MPVYNASHLLGMFSVFNASHYSTMNVAKTPVGASSAARIGGTLSFDPFYEAPSSTTGEASVGLVSSQATVRSRLGRNTHATFSLRASYINLLYGHWLRADDNDINYFLTSSSCHPKFFVKEFCYFLMPCHQHGLGVNLLVQR